MWQERDDYQNTDKTREKNQQLPFYLDVCRRFEVLKDFILFLPAFLFQYEDGISRLRLSYLPFQDQNFPEGRKNGLAHSFIFINFELVGKNPLVQNIPSATAFLLINSKKREIINSEKSIGTASL